LLDLSIVGKECDDSNDTFRSKFYGNWSFTQTPIRIYKVRVKLMNSWLNSCETFSMRTRNVFTKNHMTELHSFSFKQIP